MQARLLHSTPWLCLLSCALSVACSGEGSSVSDDGSSTSSGGSSTSSGGSSTSSGGNVAEVRADLAWLVGLAFDIDSSTTVLVSAASADQLEVLWARVGSVTRHTLTPAGGAWLAEDEIVLDDRFSEGDQCPSTKILKDAEFVFDEESLGLSVTGTLVSMDCGDDYIDGPHEGDFVAGGFLSARLPQVLGVDEPIAINRSFSFQVDKAMMGSSVATLRTDEGGVIPFTASTNEGYSVGFFADAVLPPGQSYHLSIDGTDLAGVGSIEEIMVTTEADFGLLIDGTFEEDSRQGFRGGEVLDSYGTDAPLGSRMLWGSPGSDVLIRMPAEQGASELNFDVQVVDTCGSSFGSGAAAVDFRLLAVGGKHQEVTSVIVTIGEVTTVEGKNWPEDIGELQEVSLPLPESPGDAPRELLLTFQGANWPSFLCNRSIGALIDNLVLR